MNSFCALLQPGPPASQPGRDRGAPQRPKTDDGPASEVQRFPLFDREPFRPVTEFLPQFDMKDPTDRSAMTGANGPPGPTLRALPEERTPPLLLPTPAMLPSGTDSSGNC